MLISQSKKILFIHIPRTGGTSLRQALITQVPDTQECCFQHSGVHTQGQDFFASYTGFQILTIVRNPWERIYSWYKLLRHYSRNPDEYYSFHQFVVCFDEYFSGCHPIDRFRFNQLDYIAQPSGQMVASRVLRFENYADDVSELFSELNLGTDDYPSLNQVPADDFEQAYTSELIDKVGQLAERDIRYFGYGFP